MSADTQQMIIAYRQFLVQKNLPHNQDSLDDFNFQYCVCCGKELQHTDVPVDADNALYKKYLRQEDRSDSLEIRAEWTQDTAESGCVFCGASLDCIDLSEVMIKELANFVK